MKLIWTLAVTGIAAALGGALVLRWLGAAGLPVPLVGTVLSVPDQET